jgi:hypothetical protein
VGKLGSPLSAKAPKSPSSKSDEEVVPAAVAINGSPLVFDEVNASKVGMLLFVTPADPNGSNDVDAVAGGGRSSAFEDEKAPNSGVETAADEAWNVPKPSSSASPVENRSTEVPPPSFPDDGLADPKSRISPTSGCAAVMP